LLTSLLMRMIWRVSMPVPRLKTGRRVCSAITTSSSEVFPARSPIPLTVTSAWRAPARIPASVLAVAIPRSLWQWVDTMQPSMPGVFWMIPVINAPNSSGVQ